MMNRGVLQSSPVQQMMAAGNPSWWCMNNLMKPPPPPPPPSLPNNNNNNNNNNRDEFLQVQHQYNTMNMSSTWINTDDNHAQDHQQFPQESLSQLLFGGIFVGEEAKKMGSWEEQVILYQQQQHQPTFTDQVKQESSLNSYCNNNNNRESLLVTAPKDWSHYPNYPQINNTIPVSSPQSCVTTFSSNNNNNNNNNNVLDFSSSKSGENNFQARKSDRSSECNSTATGGALKKAKVHASSSQSTFKVRKEKLGDRITALHQIVSPFGKTDTASVLLEAIGYIRFLHNHIKALSIPYLNAPGNQRHSNPVQGGGNNIFPEDPGQESNEEPKDLRSRGLCLVPVSCTLHVGNDNVADYWAPALGGGFR